VSAVALGLATPALAARLQALTDQAVQAWALRWGVPAVRCEASIAALPAGDAGQWLIDASAEPAVRVFQPRTLGAALAHLLYGDEACAPEMCAPDSLAAQSLRHVLDELLHTLSQAWGVGEWSACNAPPAELSRWQAPIHLRLQIGDAALLAALPGTRFPAAAGRVAGRGAADPLPAFGTLGTRATLVLGQAELSMADIAGLQPGDVLVLNTALSDLAEVQIAGSTAVLHAHLGRRGEQRAAQLTPPPKS